MFRENRKMKSNLTESTEYSTQYKIVLICKKEFDVLQK